MKTTAIKRKNILSVNADAKTIKGNKKGFLTGILYLAPHELSGRNVCAMAEKAGCIAACLNTAGRGGFNSVQKARINKTNRFFDDNAAFMNDLIHSIKALERKAARENLTPLVRLNGTSDIIWENVPAAGYKNIMAAFPNIQFYDYTKIPTRHNLPENYDLTFSYSGVKSFQLANAKAALNSALSRIAVVFDKRDNIPANFNGRQCIDGDDSDIRHLDARGVVVALYAKGKARRDNGGFVVNTSLLQGV